MKRNQLLLAACTLVLPAALLAQTAPTLTAANTLPVAGATFTSFSTYGFNPGAAGANQTWDFSNLSYRKDTLTSYGLCNLAGADCNRFPNANLVASKFGTNYTPSDTVTQYYNASSNLYTYLGRTEFHLSHSPAAYIYDKPRDILRFPMNYNTVFTNSWYARGTVPYRKEVTTGVDTVKADAWGTIKTPAGTFQALRVRTSCTIYDTVVLSPTMGPGGDTSITQFVNYTWYDGISKLPIYSGTINSTNSKQRFFPDIGIINSGVFGTYFKELTPSVVSVAGSPFSWTIAPNPATGNRIQVQVESAANTPVTLHLTDLMGRQVRTLTATTTGAPLVLEAAGLPAGTYILSLVKGGILQGTRRVWIAE